MACLSPLIQRLQTNVRCVLQAGINTLRGKSGVDEAFRLHYASSRASCKEYFGPMRMSPLPRNKEYVCAEATYKDALLIGPDYCGDSSTLNATTSL